MVGLSNGNIKLTKKVKKWGDRGKGIYINSEECDIFNFEVGDIIVLEIKEIIKNEERE